MLLKRILIIKKQITMIKEVIMSFQGKEFTPEMIQMVVNLKLHFDSEKKAGNFVSTQNAIKRVSTGLGIGEITVKRIIADYNKGKIKESETSETKDRGKPPYRLSDNLQPIIRDYIRIKNLKGQKISAEEIRAELIKTYNLEIPMTTFLRTLSRWGFTYGKDKRRTALREQDYVVLARRQYLRRKIANRNPDGSLKRPEVYLDETFINKNHSDWYLEEDGPWVNKPSGKGPRVIIVHAITKSGWVEDAQLIFDANKRTGDYHGQMNWENFSKWFEKQLLPNIPDDSLIIMDNAQYHNTFTEDSFPTSKTCKEELRCWLDNNRIPWTEDMLKPELSDLCKRFAAAPKFKLDQIAEAAGHKILRTPQYHPELQPIEICWAIVKNFMAAHCDYTMKNFREKLPEAFMKVRANTCEKLIAKVVKQEEKFWSEDSKLYEEIDEGVYENF